MWETGRSKEEGSTLLEMLTVLAIVGVVSALVFPQLGRASRRAQLYRDRSVLLADLRRARADAARGGHSVTVEILAGGEAYQPGRGPVRRLEHERLSGEPESIAFFPDGSARGAEWVLTGPTGSLAAFVEPGVGSVTGSAPP